MLYFQARQQIAQEYEYVKDINRTLADFKRDNFNAAPPPAKLRDYGEVPTRETRDPDVWLPPAPVERDPRLKFWLCLCIRIIVYNFSVFLPFFIILLVKHLLNAQLKGLLFFFRGQIILKGYLHCKTVTSQNVSSEAQVKNYFFS